MMKQKILLLLLLIPITLFSQDAGNEEIFDYGAGARALGLGNAYTAIADDSSAVYWNPAGLAFLEFNELMFLHAFLPYGTLYDYFSFVYPTYNLGTFGIGIFRIGTGDIIFRTSHNIITDENITSSQMQFIIGYGIKFNLPFSLGTSIKVNTVKFGNINDSNIAFDLGLLIPLYGTEWKKLFGPYSVNNLKLGITLKNIISSPIKLIDVSETEEFNLKLGLSYIYLIQNNINHKITPTFDLNIYQNKKIKMNMGLEYNLYKMGFIRFGYNQNIGLVMGAGFEYMKFRLDYSLALQEINLTHRLSLLWRFGYSIQEQRINQEQIQQAEINKKVAEEVIIKTKEYKENLDKQIEQLNIKYEKERSMITNNIRIKTQTERSNLIRELDQKLEEEKNRITDELNVQFNKERENLSKKLQADEQFKRERYNKALELFNRGDYDGAITEFETLLKFDPNNKSAREYLQRSRSAKKSPLTYSKDIMDFYYQGIDFYVAGEYKKAIEIWNKILKIDPYNNLALRNIEEAEKKLKEIEKLKNKK